MDVNAGFDMVPLLTRGVFDRGQWSRFIAAIKEHFKDDENVEHRPNYILFKVGEHPKLPLEGQKLLRFSSKVSGGCYSSEKYIDTVTQLATLYFGSRVRYWNECLDTHGHYNWAEVNESIRNYEQPDQTEISLGKVPSIAHNPSIFDPSSPVFEVKNIPGKGKGLIARRHISQGTRILCEKPLLLAKPMPGEALEAYLASALKRLPKIEQRQFLSLRNNFPGKRPFSGIFKTNALPCGPGIAVAGVYPTACLINHSCLPNSQNTWNSAEKHETIHAIREITSGEEITISYCPGGPSPTRQSFLEKSFGFQCTCKVCSLPSTELRVSNAQRLLIEKIDERIGDAMRMVNAPEDSLRECQTLLSLLKTEYQGYPGALVARLYYDAFQISVAHGDQARASVFAQRSYEARLICEGNDTPEAKRAQALAMKPSDHPSFEICSSRWQTDKDEVAYSLKAEVFEDWLFQMRIEILLSHIVVSAATDIVMSWASLHLHPM